jgi:hypothetical protein
MPGDNLQNYFRGQQVSLQWLPVLRAMATELTANADPQSLRQLFFKMGQRFASDVEDRFQGAQTLTELEDELNEFWAQLNWGWVNFSEAAGFIELAHQASPLAEAFGEDALGWSVGLLEGFYQTVFNVLGAGEAMKIRAIDELCVDMTVHLRFGQHAS